MKRPQKSLDTSRLSLVYNSLEYGKIISPRSRNGNFFKNLVGVVPLY